MDHHRVIAQHPVKHNRSATAWPQKEALLHIYAQNIVLIRHFTLAKTYLYNKKGVGPLYVTKILRMCTTEWDRVYAILGPQKDKCSTE